MLNVLPAVIWLDTGDDLIQSPAGPWLGSNGFRVQSYFHPIVLYKPNIALKDHKVHTRTQASFRDSQSPGFQGTPQSISLLAEFYGRSLNTNAMCHDPFYALNELFAFNGASELQFLNRIATILDDITTPAPDIPVNSGPSANVQSNLVYYQRLIESHVHRISETRTFIDSRGSLDWPQSNAKKATVAATRLTKDYEYLLTKAKALQKQCEREMAILRDNANIIEARRGVDQASRVFKFTVLASIYVPLSFTCSLFSMTFVQFSTSKQGLWAWATVSVPIFTGSLLIIMWNRETVLRWFRLLRRFFIL